jgi:hypothetical protein
MRLLVGSTPKAGELLFQQRVVLSTRLLASQPLHVALEPRVVVLLDTPPQEAHLPLLSLLVAVWPIPQLPKLPASLSVGYGLHGGGEGLPRLKGHRPRLVFQDLLGHIENALVSLHFLPFPWRQLTKYERSLLLYALNICAT